MVSTTASRIDGLMSDCKPRTSTQIAAALGVQRKTVSWHMNRWSRPGPSQRFCSIGSAGSGRALVYVVGQDGAPAVEQAVAAKWWPEADAVVLQSINAMVRMGARA